MHYKRYMPITGATKYDQMCISEGKYTNSAHFPIMLQEIMKCQKWEKRKKNLYHQQKSSPWIEALSKWMWWQIVLIKYSSNVNQSTCNYNCVQSQCKFWWSLVKPNQTSKKENKLIFNCKWPCMSNTLMEKEKDKIIKIDNSVILQIKIWILTTLSREPTVFE